MKRKEEEMQKQSMSETELSLSFLEYEISNRFLLYLHPLPSLSQSLDSQRYLEACSVWKRWLPSMSSLMIVSLFLHSVDSAYLQRRWWAGPANCSSVWKQLVAVTFASVLTREREGGEEREREFLKYKLIKFKYYTFFGSGGESLLAVAVVVILLMHLLAAASSF